MVIFMRTLSTVRRHASVLSYVLYGLSMTILYVTVTMFYKGPIIFSVCGGEVNFEGGYRKKEGLIKGGIKFGRNIVRGKGITNSSRGGR